MNDRVSAVVVTYNRKHLLEECLTAIAGQSYPVEKIILIDNASTDGTFEYVHETEWYKNGLIEYRLMEKNTGGAGGFCEGVKASLEGDSDWVWLMDDDTIPSSTALDELFKAKERVNAKVSFLASRVHGINGEPMNMPTLADSNDNEFTKIEDATFVSVLINMEAVKKCGLPYPEFFIWGDDTEYTMRLIKNYGPAYMIETSEVLHKRASSKNLSIKEEENENRIGMYYYFFRNILADRKLYPTKRSYGRFLLGAIRTSVTSLFTKNGLKKSVTIYKGIFSSFSFTKRVKEYISEQLKSGEQHD